VFELGEHLDQWGLLDTSTSPALTKFSETFCEDENIIVGEELEMKEGAEIQICDLETTEVCPLHQEVFTENITAFGNPNSLSWVSTSSEDAINSIYIDGALITVDSTCIAIQRENKESLRDFPLNAREKEKIQKCFLCASGSVLYIETNLRVFSWDLEKNKIISEWVGCTSLKEFYDHEEQAIFYSTMNPSFDILILRPNTEEEVIELPEINFKYKDYAVGENFVMFLAENGDVMYFDRKCNAFTKTINLNFTGNEILAKRDIVVVTGDYQVMVIDVKNEQGIVLNMEKMKIQRCEFFNSSPKIYIVVGNARDGFNLVQLDTENPTHCVNLLCENNLEVGKFTLCIDDSIVMHLNNTILKFHYVGSN
jgi:hypothetical protein